MLTTIPTMPNEQINTSNLTCRPAPAFDSPFVRAPEQLRSIFLVTAAAACGPLLAGCVLFGWRGLLVVAISVISCIAMELLYYRVIRTPSLLGRSHACLTGLLLGLTLPATVPLYIPIIASAFAIIVGKAIFGGVGHFLWQPALVGRLAVAVMFPLLTCPTEGNILAQEKVVVGDITRAPAQTEKLLHWTGRPAPSGYDAIKTKSPAKLLSNLSNSQNPQFGSLVSRPEGVARPKPPALLQLQPMKELFSGTYPGGIGETCITVILMAGLYLVFRNYIKWQLPTAFILSAGIVVAIAPIYFAGQGDAVRTVWMPFLAEGVEVGFVYVSYQLFSCELVLAAFFLATEMTSRPVTTGGQVIFGIGCGVMAMVLKLWVQAPIPCYLAILVMNTFTPTIDSMWRPRVLGSRPLLSRIGKKA